MFGKKMTKTIKCLSIGAILSLLGIVSITGLTSCSEKSEVTLESFRAEKNSYEENEQITFAITFDNSNSYAINSVVINGETYSTTSSDLTYRTVFVANENLKYSSSSSTFMLTSFTYTKNGELVTQGEGSIVTLSRAISITGNDVTLLSYDIVPENGTGQFFVNEKAKLKVILDNKNKYQVSKFVIAFKDSDGNTKKEWQIPVYTKNAEQDNSIYNADVTIPEISGDYTMSLEKIYYTKNSSLVYSEPSKTTVEDGKTNLALKNVSVNVHEIEIVTLSFEGDKIYTDFKGDNYTDESNTINLKVKLKNDSKATIKNVTINGTKYASKDFTSIWLSGYNYLTIPTKIKASAEEGSIKKAVFEISSVQYTKADAVNGVEYSEPISSETSLYVYDKVIKSAKDFDSLKVTNGIITGSYILGSNVTVGSGETTNLFNNRIFNGYLEGNGKLISFKEDLANTSVPLFKSISEKAIIRNTSLAAVNLKNTTVLAETNNGTINNVAITGTLYHQPLSTQEQTIRGGLVGVNNGMIADIDMNLTLNISGSNINKTKYKFSYICDTNNGTIRRIVNKSTRIDYTYDSSSQSNQYVFMVTRENNGAVETAINTNNNFNSDIYYVYGFDKVGNTATFSNMYINEKLLSTMAQQLLGQGATTSDLLSNVSSTTGTVGSSEYNILIKNIGSKNNFKYALESDLGYDAKAYDYSKNFYSALGFEGNGETSFWSYASGVARIQF